MIAERWYAILLIVFVAGYLAGDLARRTIERERQRQHRRTLRDVERALRQQTATQSPRTPW